MSAQQRDYAAELARHSPDQALPVALGIGDPWYRCQALSSVARRLESESQRQAALIEAFVAGGQLEEPNRVVTVSAWPLKVLALSNQWDWLEGETDRLLSTISNESSPVRRADALYWLGGAVITAHRELVLRVLHAFIAACLQQLQNGKRNRKGESRLVDFLPAIQRLEPDSVADLLARLTPAHREQAEARLAATQGESLSQIVRWPRV